MSRKNWYKIRGWWENGEAYQDGSDTIVIETAKGMKIKDTFLDKIIVFKPTHKLLHDKRTNYKYFEGKNYIFNIFKSFFIFTNKTFFYKQGFNIDEAQL